MSDFRIVCSQTYICFELFFFEGENEHKAWERLQQLINSNQNRGSDQTSWKHEMELQIA